MRNQKHIMPFKKEEPKLTPYEQAIKELDTIKQQKLWQQGRNKEYYTELTDKLRRYIVERFDINAMEMTSGEILEIIRKEPDASEVYNTLKEIMGLSDFVKFAKLTPLPDENDRSMVNAYLFVNRTKRQEIPQNQEVDLNDVADSDVNKSTEIKE